jgi:hypothetical protein
MPGIRATVHELDRVRRDDPLIGELHDLARRLLNVPRALFVDNMLFDPNAARRVVEVYRDPSGALVGFCSVRIFRRGRTRIYKATAAVLPAYRGDALTIPIGIKLSLLGKLREPFARHVYLGALACPSYCLLARFAPVLYPSAATGLPAEARALMFDLASQMPEYRVISSNPRSVIVHIDGFDVEPAPRRESAASRFFHEEVGTGSPNLILTMMPLTVGNLLGSAASWLRHRLSRPTPPRLLART